MSVSRRYKIYGVEGDIAQRLAVEQVLRVSFDTDSCPIISDNLQGQRSPEACNSKIELRSTAAIKSQDK